MKKIIALLFFLLAAFVVAFLVIQSKQASAPEGTIANFEECVKAGYPVMESYPRRCAAPGGPSFVEQVLPEKCQNDAMCGTGQFCRQGTCEAFTVEDSCRYDSDCALINENDRFACCWTGACGTVDYSESRWIAVNEKWYNSTRSEICPDETACGLAPGCARRPGNMNFAARCLGGTCQKVATPVTK